MFLNQSFPSICTCTFRIISSWLSNLMISYNPSTNEGWRRNLESNEITVTWPCPRSEKGPTFSCIAWWMHGKKMENWGFLPVSFRNNTSYYSLQLSFIWKASLKHKHLPAPCPSRPLYTGTYHRVTPGQGQSPHISHFWVWHGWIFCSNTLKQYAERE